MQFVWRHAERMWPNEKTRQNTIARVARFDAFDDYSKETVKEVGPKPKTVKDISALHIYDWLDAEKKRCISKPSHKNHPKYPSDATINRYTSAVSAVLAFAVELKLRPDAPKLRYTQTFGRERYMTDQEVARLISHFLERGDQWMADLCFVGANTGMRLGEILHLGWVNCGRNSHWGEATILDDSVHLPPHITKTKMGRYVSINPDVRAACVRLQESIGKHFTHRKFYDRWNDARDRIAPGDEEFVFHTLRHTACSNLYRRTLDIRLTQRFARHKSIITTSIYAHPSDDELMRSVRDLPC